MFNRCISYLILRLLSSLVSRLLKKPLSHFITFNDELPFFNIGFVGFSLRLEQLKLHSKGWNEVLLKASLPLQVHTVLIESVSVHWAIWAPITIEANGIYFLLNTTSDHYHDVATEEKNAILAKRKRLEEIHFGSEKDPVQKPSWIRRKFSSLKSFFISYIITKVKINHISSIHLRIEDEISLHGSPLVAGIRIENISIVQKKKSEKYVEVQQISAYMNCRDNSALFYHQTEGSALERLQAFPSNCALSYDYILKPASLSGNLCLKRGKVSLYDFHVGVQCSALVLQVSKEQLRAFIKFLSFIKQYQCSKQFLRFRPSVRPIQKENAREWWQFAFKSVLQCMEVKNGTNVWKRLQYHQSLGKEYSRLYEQSFLTKKLGKKMKDRIQVLEDEMDLLTTMVCRSRVWRNLRPRRVIEDLSDYLTMKRGNKNYDTPDVIMKRTTPQAAFVSISLDTELTDVQLELTEAPLLDQIQDRVLVTFKGHAVKLKVSHKPILFRIGFSIDSVNLTGFASDNEDVPILFHQAHVSSTNHPLFSVDLTALHNTSSKHHTPNMIKGVFDYDVKANLKQTVFVFDKKTALKMAEVSGSLMACFNTELRHTALNHAEELKQRGKTRAARIVTSREMIHLDVNMHLPSLVLPNNSNRISQGDVAIKLGQLKLITALKEAEQMVQYDLKLTGTSLGMIDSPSGGGGGGGGGGWEMLLSSSTKIGLTTQLSCPKVKFIVESLYEGTRIISCMKVDGRIYSIEVGISDSTLESGIQALSKYMDTAVEIKEAAHKPVRNEEDQSYASRSNITSSHVIEVVEKIHKHSTPISRQSVVMEIQSTSPVLEFSCHIDKISFELSSQDKFLGGTVERIAVESRQYGDSTHHHLDVFSASLVESSIITDGVEVRPLIATQYNIQSKQFLSVGVTMADPSSISFKSKYHYIKNQVDVDVGPLAVSVSDESLFNWTKFFLHFSDKIEHIDFSKVKPETKSKTIPPRRGIVKLEEEISLSLEAGSAPITKLYLTGIKADVKDSVTHMECTGSVNSLLLLDSLEIDDTGSKVLSSKDSVKVFKFKSKLKKTLPGVRPRTITASHSRPALDPTSLSANLSTDVTVGGVSCTVLVKYMSTMQGYFQNIVKIMSDNLRSKDSKGCEDVKPNSNKPFKYHLSVNIHTFSLTFPEKIDSVDALEVHLESLLVSNKYSQTDLSGAGGEEYHPLMEMMQLEFHKISLTRSNGEKVFRLFAVPGVNILFSRILSSGIPIQAFRSEPQFKVTLDAETLEVYASNEDITVAYSIVQGNIEEEVPISFVSDSQAIRNIVDPTSTQDGGREHSLPVGEDGDEDGSYRVFQMDMALNKLEWNMEYCNRVPSKDLPHITHVQSIVRTKLVVVELQAFIDLSSDSSFSGDVLIMDVTLKEISPTSPPMYYHLGYNDPSSSNDAYIIQQDLYYKKTRPPKAGGGTMDTRRSSSTDALFHLSLSYAKEDIKVKLVAQYIHICVWPSIINPIIAAITTPKSSNIRPEKKAHRPKDEAHRPPKHRVEFKMQVNNTSLAVLDRPSNSSSYGICLEIVSPSKGKVSEFRAEVSSAATLLSVNPLYFKASMIQFGQKILKLTQVVDPCFLKLMYNLVEGKETVEASVSSPFIITLSMEAIHGIAKPILKVLKSGRAVSERRQQQPLSGNIWELKKIEGYQEVMEEVMELSDVESRDTHTPVHNRVQSAELHVPSIMVNFDLISAGSSHSVVNLIAKIEAAVSSWSYDITSDVLLELNAFIYSHRVDSWEPLIELVEDPLHKKYRRWSMIAKMRQINENGFSPFGESPLPESSGYPTSHNSRSHSLSEASSTLVDSIVDSKIGPEGELTSNVFSSDAIEQSRDGGKVKEIKDSIVMIITSDDRLEFTFSPGVMDTIFMILEASNQEDYIMEKNLAKCSNFYNSSLVIKNKTGLKISVYPGSTFSVGDSLFSNAVDLPPITESIGAECPKPPDPDTNTIARALSAVTKSIPFLDNGGNTLNTPKLKVTPEPNKSVVTLAYARQLDLRKDDASDMGINSEEDILESDSSESRDKQNKNSLNRLRNYIKQKKEASPKTADTDDPLSENWKPNFLNNRICIQSDGGMKSKPVSITLAQRIPIPLYYPSFGGVDIGGNLVGVCEVENIDETRVVTIRSALQIKNEYPLPISLYEHNEHKNELMSVVEPNGTYNIPVPIVMEKISLKIGIGHCGLFSEDVLDWSALIDDTTSNHMYISCPAELSLRHKVYLLAMSSVQSAVVRAGVLDQPLHLITLKPAFVIHNLLPMAFHVTTEKDSQQQQQQQQRMRRTSLLSSPRRDSTKELSDAASLSSLDPGEMKDLQYIDPSKEHKLTIEVPNYRGLKWRGILTSDPQNHHHYHSQVKLKAFDEKGEQVAKMKIGVYSDQSAPSLYRLYCPYWICNKTSMKLEYEYHSSSRYQSVKIVDGEEENPITLIYFKHETERKDRKVKIRLAQQGQWSKHIYLSNTGANGTISAKSKEGVVYEFGMQNNSSPNILTRVINILPKYVVYNSTKMSIRLSNYSEEVKGYVIVDPNKVETFWPGSGKECIIHFQEKSGSWSHATKPFPLTSGTLCLATDMKEELSGISVDVSLDETCSFYVVTLSHYAESVAQYRIENRSNRLAINFHQNALCKDFIIPPGFGKLYEWDNPLLKRQLYWQVVGEKQDMWTRVEDKSEGTRSVMLIEKDSTSEGEKGNGPTEVHWKVTYEGSQKILQIFDDIKVCRMSDKNKGRGSKLQVLCSMEGLGVSLLDDKPVEVMYCSILSSPAVWLKRTGKSGKTRVLDEEQLLKLEATWRSGKKEITIDSETFDLDELKGDKGGSLTRSYNPGFWGWILVEDNYYKINVKVGRLQIDNQLRDYTLDSRIIFASEKIIVPEHMVSPIFTAGVVVRRPSPGEQLTLFEDAYVKVKDLQVNLEIGLVAALFPLIEPFLSVTNTSKVFTYSDATVLPLGVEDVQMVSKGQKSEAYFQSLAISQIKIALTYTTMATDNLSGVLGDLVDSLITIGGFIANGTISITLDSLRTTESVSVPQLYNITTRHYKTEILGQIHSVIFGLDIIGNPSKFFGNIESGVKDFIDEAEKGFEKNTIGSEVIGIAVGVQSLLGHVVEGSTDSLGSATGSFRNALLGTTDLDYRRKHLRLERETSETLGANLLLGTNLFLDGLVGGLTDIFIKPITGASKSGVKGFFHGVGKGTLSILTKPTLGVVDLAYFTLEGIGSTVDDDVEIHTVRLPRLIHHNRLITHYNTHEAQGLRILWYNSDSKGTEYYGHCWLPPTEEGKDPKVLLINSANILKLKRENKRYKVDDLNVKLEYVREWDVQTDDEGTTSLFIKYDEDSKLERVGSFLGITKTDHNPEIFNQTTVLRVDSLPTAEFLVNTITKASEGVLVRLATSPQSI